MVGGGARHFAPAPRHPARQEKLGMSTTAVAARRDAATLRMTGLMRPLPFAASIAFPLAVIAVGCGSEEPVCSWETRFAITANRTAINVAGYDSYDCTVTFSSGSRSVSTVVTRTSAATTLPPPNSPTMPNGSACQPLSAPNDSCVIASSQATPYCLRSKTCLYFEFNYREANKVDLSLGPATTYDVRVECGGVLVNESIDRPRSLRQCAL